MKFGNWTQRAKELRTETRVLYLALKDPRTPWYAKFLAACVVAYVLSPIDLIPDFIPVLGYLDDLIVLSLGIGLLTKMIPPKVLAECREKAQAEIVEGKLLVWVGTVIIIAIWILVALVALGLAVRLISTRSAK